jgi:hypothetical protein
MPEDFRWHKLRKIACKEASGSDTSFLEYPPSTVVPKKHKIVPALMDRAVCKYY